MKIYSWNMLFRNTEQERAFQFIATGDFDIFCLQEVPQDFLERILALPYYHAYTIDVERLAGGNAVPIYLVILSRHKILEEHYVSFPDYWPELPLRTRAFVHIMRPFHFTKIRNRSGLLAHVALPSGVTQVFNLHLILSKPSFRIEEFEKAMALREPTQPAIVCGDFNILESPSIAVLNWLLGGTMSDAWRHERERTRIEERFVAYEFRNVLRGKTTHQLSRSQLDHVLVTNAFSIKNAEVIRDSYGSDHQPVLVETT